MNAQNGPDRSELSAFLDGQLPPEQTERLADALQKDPALRAELEALEATRNLLADLPRETAPEGMLESVMETIERQRLLHAAPTVETGRAVRWGRRLATAAVLLLTVGLGVFLHTQLSGNEDWVERQERAAGPEMARSVEPDETADDKGEKAATEAVAVVDRADVERLKAPRAEVSMARRVSRPSTAPPLPKPSTAEVRNRVMAKKPALAGKAASASPPVVSRSLAFKGDRPQFGQMMTDLRVVTLNTADPAATNAHVAAVLASNGIVPISGAAGGLVGPADRRGRVNVWSERRLDRGSNRIEFFVDQARAKALAEQIQRVEKRSRHRRAGVAGTGGALDGMSDRLQIRLGVGADHGRKAKLYAGVPFVLSDAEPARRPKGPTVEDLLGGAGEILPELAALREQPRVTIQIPLAAPDEEGEDRAVQTTSRLRPKPVSPEAAGLGRLTRMVVMVNHTPDTPVAPASPAATTAPAVKATTAPAE